MTTSFKVESCWNKNQIIHKLLIYISRDLYIETRPVRVIEGGQVLALNQIHHYSQFCLIVFSLFIRTTTYLSPDVAVTSFKIWLPVPLKSSVLSPSSSTPSWSSTPPSSSTPSSSGRPLPREPACSHLLLRGQGCRLPHYRGTKVWWWWWWRWW